MNDVREANLAAYERARAACSATVVALQSAQVQPEALASYIEPRRKFLIMRTATMQPQGEAWRLGTLLLATDGSLLALGRSTRAAERGRPGYQSESREERRDLAAAALHGGYQIGTAVNFDAVPLPLDSSLPANAVSPVAIANGEVRVRWRPGAPFEQAPTLEAYLAERAGLLINPPLGA